MPHLGVGDRVKETTTTTGTGTLNLDGAVAGFQTFVDGVGNGHETYYVIVDSGTGDYEVGVGTITDAATDTLSRDSVITSSNAGSLVNFGAGTKDVFCSLPSERAVIIDDASNVEVTANVTATAFDGSGAALTSLNASNVSSGTLDNARLDAQLQDIAGLATTSGKIIQGDGANFVLSSYTIPTSDGTTGQVLTTNGSGAVTFQTPTVGDITAVTAGSGLTGGGTTGDVTLNVGAGTGVTVNADDIAIGQDVATSASPTFAGASFTANVALGDLDHILMGATGEYQIYHDHANGVSVIKDVDVGGKINIEADSISLTGPVTATANVSLGDNDYLRLGAGNDLQIYHDGSNSYVSDQGTGSLFIQATDLILENSAGTNYLYGSSGGSVILYYNGDEKFRTGSAGVTVTGTVTADGVSLGDSESITFGASNDLIITHDGSNSIISDTGTGDLRINGQNIHLRDSSGNNFITLDDGGTGGTVKLYHLASEKLSTTTDGIAVTGGATFTANVSLGDGDYLNFGASNDMYIGHTGTASLIRDNGTGDLFVDSVNLKFRNAAASQTYATFTENGSVDLYYNNSKKFETTSAGATVNGALTTTSTITSSSGTSSFETVDVSGEFNMTGTGTNIMDFNATAVVARWLGSSPAFEEIFRATRDAEISLKYNGSTKLETTSTGVTVTGTLTETSSIEYKENVQPLEFNEAIYNVNAVKYDRKDGSQKDEVGVIAEDLYEILPDLVQTKDGKPESVKYTKLTMYLLEALKKQNEEIQELKKRIN